MKRFGVPISYSNDIQLRVPFLQGLCTSQILYTRGRDIPHVIG